MCVSIEPIELVFFSRGKSRPIVVKFADTDSKLLIKSALKSVNLRQTTCKVVEQFPQEVM